MNDQLNFQRLDDGKTWGVKAQGFPAPSVKPGDTVQVPKRNGGVTTVKLGAKVSSWNGGRAVVFTIDRGEGAKAKDEMGTDPFRGPADRRSYELRSTDELQAIVAVLTGMPNDTPEGIVLAKALTILTERKASN